MTGERLVTPSSIVNLNFQARYVYPTTLPSTPSLVKPKLLPNGDDHLNTVDGEEKLNGDAGHPDSVADVEEELIKDESKGESDVKEKMVQAAEKVGKKIGKRGKKEEKKDYPPNGYAHAPRWPQVSICITLILKPHTDTVQLRKPHFQVLLGDSKLDKVIVQPIRITDLPLPRPDGLASEPREYSLQFQAPHQANLYSFVLHAASDTFLGCDVSRPIMVSPIRSLDRVSVLI